MLTAALHQRTASTYARRAQVAFVTLGVGATALAAFALRTPQPVETPSLSIPVAKPGKTDGSGRLARAEEFDPSAIDRRIRQIGNYPVPVVEASPEDPNITQVPVPVPEETVKFLGALTEPTRRVALLKIGEHQRLLGPGESDGDVTVVEVHDDRVEITLKGSATQTLTKQARSGPTVTYVAASAASPNSGGFGMPGNPGDAGNIAGTPTPGGRGRRGNTGRPNPAADEAAANAARDAAANMRNKVLDGREKQ